MKQQHNGLRKYLKESIAEKQTIITEKVHTLHKFNTIQNVLNIRDMILNADKKMDQISTNS